MIKNGYKECPVCFEEIREKALLCRFCGAVLTDKELPAIIPKEQIQAMEKALADHEPEKRPVPKKPKKKEKNAEQSGDEAAIDMADLREVIATRYEGMEPTFAIKHRHKLEEFLKKSEDEYRTSSVLFIDITGYTALSEKVSPETVKDMLDSFYEVCTQVIGRYNGFIVKYAGDAALAVFGAPVAYDRDVESCVKSALEIREMVRLFPTVEGIEIQVSAGIATGTILSSITTKQGKHDFDVFGPAVNLAARIEAAADADTIRVCPDTFSQIQTIFELKELPPSKFKNVAKPVVTYEVMRAIDEKEITRRDFSMPFVGRTREIDRLSANWAAFRKVTEKTGEAGLSKAYGHVLVGMPGMGKSRLSRQFLENHTDGSRFLWAECNPHDAKIPYGLWRLAICRLWEGRTDDPAKDNAEQLVKLVEKAGDEGAALLKATDNLLALRAMFGAQNALAKAKPMGEAYLRRQMQADLTALLDLMSSKAPLILFLDDLQWADQSSLEILESLATPPCLKNVFFHLAQRSGFTLPGDNVQKLPKLTLHEMEEQGRRKLLSHLAQIDDILPEIRNALIQQSSGNPLFLVEMVRSLNTRISQLDSDLSPEQIAENIREWVPSSLKGMLESRVDLLDRRRKLVLQCGAVLGQRFAFQLIELFQVIKDGLLARLYSLKGLEYLEDVETPRELEFLFRHHMIRETAYQSLLERQRSEFHGLIARRMEHVFKNRIKDFYPVLAYHFHLANERTPAIEYLRLAADQAKSQAALSDALEFYDEALKQLQNRPKNMGSRAQREEDQTRLHILYEKGRIHRLLGQYDLSIIAFKNARNIPTYKKNALVQAYQWAEQGRTLLEMSDYSAAEKAFRKALNTGRKEQETMLIEMATDGAGRCAWGLGKWAAARKAFQKVLDISIDTTDLDIRADAQNNLSLLDWKAGNLQSALIGFKATLQLRRKVGNRFGITLTLINLAIIEENLGRFTQAEKRYRQALDLADRLHYAQAQAAICANLGNLALVQENYTEAVELNARSLDIANTIGDQRSAAIALENLSLSHGNLMQFQTAKKNVKEARRIARKIGDEERLFSLDLAEIEITLVETDSLLKGGASKVGGRMPAAHKKLAAATTTLDTQEYHAERPRLLRLQAWAYFLTSQNDLALKAIEKAHKEIEKQDNSSEAHQLLRIEKRFA